MTDLGNRYALSALKLKRAEMAGEVLVLKKKLKWLEDSLRHIDASLMIFDPVGNPSQIPVKRPQKRIKLFRQGQLGAMILKALRSTKRPMGTHDIVTALIEANGYGEGSRMDFGRRVRSNLTYLVARGTVTQIGKGRGVTWSAKTK